MPYTVKWSDGRTDRADTYAKACRVVRAEYPDAAIGHDGDLSEGGDRSLCWANEASSTNDDGARAIASIRRDGE